jgi:hypothetical protein
MRNFNPYVQLHAAELFYDKLIVPQIIKKFPAFYRT